MSDLYLKIEILAGTDIPMVVIPQMVDMANKTRANIEAKLNGVNVVAKPGDEPLLLAIAWRISKEGSYAFAEKGKDSD